MHLTSAHRPELQKEKGCVMAKMPKGQPRSVPDPLAEQYAKMIEDASREGFSGPDRRLDFSDAPRGDGSLVKIGDNWYRSMDNGQAQVLVPVANPLFSPAELAQQQQGIRQALLDASYPIAGAASGVAALAGASPAARDLARMLGAAVDTTLSLGAARRPPAPRAVRAEVVPPPQVRPSARYGELNAKGQAGGMNATLASPMLGTGTRANRRLTPPGWSGHGTNYNEGRGHLLAAGLGGSGRDMRNIVTLTQNPTNTPWMQDFERAVARRVQDGEVVEYSATPLYGDALRPSALLLTAHGSKNGTSAKVVSNTARRRK